MAKVKQQFTIRLAKTKQDIQGIIDVQVKTKRRLQGSGFYRTGLDCKNEKS